MTRRIEAVLEILAEVRAATEVSPTLVAIREQRLITTKQIAKRRQCDVRSVRDTHNGQLQPEIPDIAVFDNLVREWITKGDRRLQAILIRHGDEEDGQRINRFFDAPPVTHAEEKSVRSVVVELPGEIGFAGGFVEGATRRVVVNAYERNPKARSTCIAFYRPICAVCDCNFGAIYGSVAEGFIHVHHLKPLSEVGEAYAVDPINDLRPVCPNCHAVIHLGGECRTIDEVRRHLGKPPMSES